MPNTDNLKEYFMLSQINNLYCITKPEIFIDNAKKNIKILKK